MQPDQIVDLTFSGLGFVFKDRTIAPLAILPGFVVLAFYFWLRAFLRARPWLPVDNTHATQIVAGRSTGRLSLKPSGLLLVCLVLLLGGPATGFTQDISRAELVKIGNSAAQFRKADDFSQPFDDRVALGRTFRVAMPFKRNEIPSMPDKNEGWTYNSDTQQLTLTVAGHGWTTMHRPDPDLHLSFSVLEGFEISNAIAHRGHQREQNAFGAQVDVDYANMTSVGLAAITSDAIARSVKFDRDWNTLVSHLSIAPDDARKKIRPYSIAVAPDSFFTNNTRRFFKTPSNFITPNATQRSLAPMVESDLGCASNKTSLRESCRR